MQNLWNPEIKFPTLQEMNTIPDMEQVLVHTAIDGEYQFLLGAAITKYRGMFYASWGNSFRGENDDNTILAQKKSTDGGRTWCDYKRISDKTPGYGRSHGIYFEHDGKLFAFCPKAQYDKIDSYPDLKTEGYVMDDNGEFVSIGIILDADFWPMCQPVVLENGGLVMAGLETVNAQAAVALCDGQDITKWEMVVIPNPAGFRYWGETTLLKTDGKLAAIIRGRGEPGPALYSESRDNGRTWTGITQSNLPITQSKMYAGTLSNGINYLVFNAKSDAHRETLCIAVGQEYFERVYLIRHGFDAPPKYWSRNEWCYPYAYEADGKLFVIYAKNKEDCELSIIPIESLR